MVTSSSCITQTFPFRRVEKLKIDAQVQKLLHGSIKPTIVDTSRACYNDRRGHEGLQLVAPGNRDHLIYGHKFDGLAIVLVIIAILGFRASAFVWLMRLR